LGKAAKNMSVHTKKQAEGRIFPLKTSQFLDKGVQPYYNNVTEAITRFVRKEIL